MQLLMGIDSDSDTDDIILEQLIADKEDSQRELQERKVLGPFHIDQKSDAWYIEHCR